MSATQHTSSPQSSNPKPAAWNPPNAPTQPADTTETADTTTTRHPGRGTGAAGTGVGSGVGQSIRGQVKRAGDAIRRSFGAKDEAAGEEPGGMLGSFLSVFFFFFVFAAPGVFLMPVVYWGGGGL